MAGLTEVELVSHLHDLLGRLRASPYPDLPSPAATNRRASVALVIRIQPSYAHWPSDSDKATDLDAFFAQDWVRHGEPEALFIKRASRKGDRWTSHIALPGGKRDADDADDQAAAVRETWEEVGLDLAAHALPCGNLPQRIVTTHWGKKPLLVLCPYVFLLTTPAVPPLRLQPTEVAATHWVSIRSLQSPERRTMAFEDVSSRLANQETGAKKWMLRLILGKMMFAAINLMPTESLHSTVPAVLQQLQDNRHTLLTRVDRLKALVSRAWLSDIFGQTSASPPEVPLLLWGLTLGAVSDFLDLLPPHNALTLWSYPTFTPLDVRFVVWLMTYRFKHRKRVELQAGHNPPFGYESTNLPAPGSQSSSRSEEISRSTVLVSRPDETGLHGVGTGSAVGERWSGGGPSEPTGRKAAVATMLEGCVERLVSQILPEITDRARYYDIVRRAVAVALIGRASVAMVLAIIIWRRLRRRRAT